MIALDRRLPPNPQAAVAELLLLTAEERMRSRHRFVTPSGMAVQLLLPRGTVLHDNDLLSAADGGMLVRVKARPEPVLTARAMNVSDLVRAAYHLGNRHVALELGPDYLRLSPDPVLADLLQKLGLAVIEDTAPFAPEGGAYATHPHSQNSQTHVPFRAHR